jgi:hypothetical protein
VAADDVGGCSLRQGDLVETAGVHPHAGRPVRAGQMPADRAAIAADIEAEEDAANAAKDGPGEAPKSAS